MKFLVAVLIIRLIIAWLTRAPRTANNNNNENKTNTEFRNPAENEIREEGYRIEW